MATETVKSIFECLAGAAIILGFVFEDKLIAFEEKLFSAAKRVFKAK